MIKLIARHAVTLLLLLGLGGCATEKLAGGTVHIALLPDDMVSVDGTKIEIVKLGKKLKSLGATTTTTIMVSVPRIVSTGTLSSLTKSLAAEGFQKILFTKPAEVGASVTNRNSTNQPPTRATAPARSSGTRTTNSQRPVRSGTL